PAAPAPAAPDEPLFDLTEPDPFAVAPAAEPPSTPPPPAAAPPSHGTASDGKPLVSLMDELGLDDDEDEASIIHEAQQAAQAAQAAKVAQSASGSMPIETSGADAELDAPPPAVEAEAAAGWLDELDGGGDDDSIDTLFDEEDDFFNLAAELEDELSDDELLRDTSEVEQPQEQSLEEIVEGFRRGVAENLSTEDYGTHFNLGIAYREMGLLDEAIGAFQLAAKDDRYRVESSSMLGMCFLDKGLPELAVKWYRKGLEAPTIQEEETLGLLYDMGAAFEQIGDVASARKTFVEIYGINSNYRDIATRLETLAPGDVPA
ncbi:MAG: tetratricopeptide repeat protein, partial [Acidobacteriota bacterium]